MIFDFSNACHIAYPLSAAIDRHLAEEQRSDDLKEEVSRYVRMYTEDRSGIGTLRGEEPDLEDRIDMLIAEIVTRPIDSRTVEQVKEFRLEVFRAASRVAGRKIAAAIEQACEDAALERWERRQERCE